MTQKARHEIFGFCDVSNRERHLQQNPRILLLQEQGENNVGSNMWVTDPWPVKRQRIAYMQQRGPGCFDNHYYLQKNPDLKVIPTALEL